MKWTQLRVGAVAAAAIALAACSSQATAGTVTGAGAGASAGTGTNASAGAGAVRLNPASGATSGRPTWSTTQACPSGHKGSAVFREVHHDGSSTNSISEATNQVAAPFGGTLQASIARIQAAGGIPNGGTQQLVIICFSGPSGTGTQDRAMSLYITYSADGSKYTTSAAKPAGA